MESIDLLLFLKEFRGATLKDIMKRYHIGRTAALYHIAHLKAERLITSYKKGKALAYLPVSGAQLTRYFQKKIADIDSDIKKLTDQQTATIHTPRSQKLTLAFINYYDLLPKARTELEQFYNIIDYSNTQLYISQEEFLKRAKDADVIVNNYACQITDELLSQLPKLQYMHLATYMHWYVDLSACKKYNIHISNIPYSYKAIAVNEFMLAQTFTLLRQTLPASQQLQSGVNEFRYFRGEQLKGKKAIILGIDISTEALLISLRGLGADVSIYTEDKNEDPAFYGLHHFATEEEVFETGDIFYISWGGNESKPVLGQLGKTLFDKIKRPVYIISVYRHRHIDFQRIRELVYEGKIRGIAFDYFPEITEGDSLTPDIKKILYLPNVLATPDIAWYTNDSLININTATNERLIAYAKGDNSYLLL